MSRKITAKPRQHLANATACSLAGDSDGWKHHMKLWGEATRDCLEQLKQRVEQIQD